MKGYYNVYGMWRYELSFWWGENTNKLKKIKKIAIDFIRTYVNVFTREQFHENCIWTNICLNIIFLKSLPHLPEAEEVIWSCFRECVFDLTLVLKISWSTLLERLWNSTYCRSRCVRGCSHKYISDVYTLWLAELCAKWLCYMRPLAPPALPGYGISTTLLNTRTRNARIIREIPSAFWNDVIRRMKVKRNYK